MTTIIYGISNCDTVKKARRWLDDHAIDHHFHDFRKEGLSNSLVKTWIDTIGIETLVNKRGTTYRLLSDDVKQQLESDPIPVLCEQPTLIKRPVLVTGKNVHVGFSNDQYQSYFRTHSL